MQDLIIRKARKMLSIFPRHLLQCKTITMGSSMYILFIWKPETGL